MVGTAGQYTVYKNTSAAGISKVKGTVIPWWAVFSMLALALCAVAVDWFRPGKGPGPDDADIVDDMAREVAGRQAVDRKKVLAVVPCLNEARNVQKVISDISRSAPFADILVVDDGSTDSTAYIAGASGALVISHKRNMGIGATVRTGMSFALKAGYQYVVQVDGDRQHDARYMRQMISMLEGGEVDVVVGSRFLGAAGYRPPLPRMAGIKMLAWIVTKATGQIATDTTSGFRAINRRALCFLVNNYPDDFAEPESLVLMALAGVRWSEIPVAMRPRENGTSSIRGIVPAWYMVKVIGCITMDTLRLRAVNPAIAG